MVENTARCPGCGAPAEADCVRYEYGGGLAVARDHERERLVEEQKRPLAMQQSSPLAHDTSALTPSMAAWASGRSNSNTTVEHLLSDALGLFLK